jgi:hypothetical protein
LIVNVGARAEPAYDVPVLVAHCDRAGKEPARRPVMTDEAVLHLVRRTGLDRVKPPRARRSPIFTIGKAPPRVVDALLGAHAGVFEHRAIGVILIAVRRRGEDQIRNRFGNAPHLTVALIARGALIVHVHRRADPVERKVSERRVDPAQVMPPIHSVRPAAHAERDFQSAAAQNAHQQRKVGRMHERVALLKRRSGGKTGVFHPGAVDERQPVAAIGRPNHDRKRVGKLTETIVRGRFQIGAIRNGDPRGHRPARIALRNHRQREHRVFAVRRAQPATQLEGQFAAPAVLERAHHALEIVGMER